MPRPTSLNPPAAHALPAALGQSSRPKPPLTSSQVSWLDARSAQLRAFDMHELLIRSAISARAHGDHLRRLRLAGRRSRAAARCGRSARTARQITASNLNERLGLERPRRRVPGTRRYPRRSPRTAPDRFRLPAALRGQRLPRAAHPARPGPRAPGTGATGNPSRPRPSGGPTCERLLASSQQQDRLIDALLTLARSETGLSTRGSFELSTVIDIGPAQPRTRQRGRRDFASRPRSARPPSAATTGWSRDWCATWSTTRSGTTSPLGGST